MNRRRFIKRGLLGGVLLSVGGGLALGLSSSKLAFKPLRTLKVLGERHFAVLAAIAARTVRVEGADPVQIAHTADEMLSIAIPEAKEDVRAVLMLFESALAGFLLDGRIRPFTQLEPAHQDAVLAAWRDSRMVVRRGGYQALRKLSLAAYYSSPSTWQGLGYPGPPEIAES